MIEISEVMYQWQQGRSKSKIALSLGITRPTVRNYLKLAVAAGLTTESIQSGQSGINSPRHHRAEKSADPVIGTVCWRL